MQPAASAGKRACGKARLELNWLYAPVVGQGHCVVFLGKTLYSHSASLHPGV